MFYQKALNIWKKTARKTITDIYAIASIYKKLEQYEKAKVWFQRVIRKTHSINIRAGAQYHLGEILLKEGKIADAYNLFHSCCTLMPQHKKAQAYIKNILRKI